MKKIYSWLLGGLVLCGGAFTSCSSDESGGPATQPENTFTFADVQYPIKSVVYTYDKETKFYSFYFSPTAGLMDLDIMLMANDYIKINTKTPAGDLMSMDKNGCSVDYKGLEMSAQGPASLYVLLGSVSTIKMDLNVTLTSGETLVGNYYGFCVFCSDEGEAIQTPPLTTQIFARYMGSVKAGTSNYYLAVTNAEFTVGASNGTPTFELTSEGYALVLDFYGTPSEDWREFPVGTFSESQNNEDHTYFADYSYVLHRNAQGEKETLSLVDEITIQRDNETGETTITATYIDADYAEYTIIFSGELRIADGTFEAYLPQYENDLNIEGVYCQGAYLGDEFSTGSGLVQLVISDWKWDNGDVGGSSISLSLFGPKFNDPKERKLVLDTYTVSDELAQGTWMPGTEIVLMGYPFPYGTYACYDDGSQSGLYTYAATGTITIAHSVEYENKYRIDFDMTTANGFSLKGYCDNYDGYLEDQSDDAKSDQSSTLESDYAMDLEYIQRASCYPQTEIYFEDKGLMPLDYITSANPGGVASGFQIIEIGFLPSFETDESGAHHPVEFEEGDVMRLELLVDPDKADQITPGVYNVTTSRFPANFKPGVCPRGYMTSDGVIGTRWLKVVERLGMVWVDENENGVVDEGEMKKDYPTGYASYDDYACLYGGSVTIEKAEGGENWFTFTIEGEDVAFHKVTGTWTGPVYLNDTDTPVVSSGNEFPATSSVKSTARRLPASPSVSKEQIVSAIKAQHSFK